MIVKKEMLMCIIRLINLLLLLNSDSIRYR